ncbi:MAG: ABC transporter ATP-binding protein [Tissierellaceae bacterium]|nr:ABC transporter ATP-binding protein [Tissierellaceae bacterium]
MFLEIKNLTKKYNYLEVVKDISFSIEEKEIICILGPSGCGKTTILQAIGGFIDIDGGGIILNGKNIEKLDAEERNIATVFQSYGLFPHKTVLENIIYGLKFRKVKKREAVLEGKRMLDILNLRGYGDKRVTALSGGEQQRVALGRALIVKPKLLLLDEPFSNLDTKLRISMREELLRIREVFNITMLFVTHDQEDAFSIADRIILMNKGRIEQIDSARSLYFNPKSEFALKFIGSSNIKDGYFVRPESIKVTSHGGKEARVMDKTFKGSFMEYIIKYQNSSYLMYRLNNEEELQIGSKIYIEMGKKKI